MSTWDTMSEADYAACVDAGRVPASVVADESPRGCADEARKVAKERGGRQGIHMAGRYWPTEKADELLHGEAEPDALDD